MTEYVEGKFQSLLDILPPWVKAAGADKCLIQLFVSFFDLKNGRAIGELNSCYEKFTLKYATFLRVIELHELKLVMPSTSFAKPRDGVLHWFNYLEDKKIEPGVYAILGAPFASDHSSVVATEADARAALSSLAAMISILYGFASLHSKKCELAIDTTSGNYSISSPIIENPAFFKIDHAKDIPIAETFQFSSRLEGAPTKSKDLVAVALTYLDRAMRESNHGVRLSLYFSAIEVLAGETSTNNLCKILSMSHHDLRSMGYNNLLDRRTLFIHKGQMISLERGEERFLQYLIVDAISGTLGNSRTTYAMEYQIELGKLTTVEHIRS